MSDISVIIPVKNRAGLLRKTLDNLLAQSKKPDEIIVVDDHSEDDIKLVIFEYITDCIFLSNKGNGPGSARNLGLQVATGKYIQFFDSDDLLTPRKIEKQFHALEKTNADMAYGPYVMAEETENTWLQRDVIMQWNPLPGYLPLKSWMLRGWNILTQACLFRKSLIDSAAAWNEQLITHEDYLYLFRLSLLNPAIIHVPEEAVIYRQHGLQSTDNQTKTQSRAKDKMEVMTEIKSLLPGSGCDFFSQGLFRGRMSMNVDFLKKTGSDIRRYQGFMDPQDAFWAWAYRAWNKQKRNETKSLWEPMHGVNGSVEAFQHIMHKIKNG